MQSRHSLPVPPCQEAPSLNYINHQSMGGKKNLDKVDNNSNIYPYQKSIH